MRSLINQIDEKLPYCFKNRTAYFPTGTDLLFKEQEEVFKMFGFLGESSCKFSKYWLPNPDVEYPIKETEVIHFDGLTYCCGGDFYITKTYEDHCDPRSINSIDKIYENKHSKMLISNIDKILCSQSSLDSVGTLIEFSTVFEYYSLYGNRK